ncbi:MAG: DUF2569 family protein [bacterium]|nr:DUF2569 family protein [bacterium]
MFCSKCGRQIKEDSQFCEFCGSKTIIKNGKSSANENLNDYIWAYKFDESGTNTLSVARNFLEQKGDYYVTDKEFEKNNIYVYKSDKYSNQRVIIFYKHNNEVYVFANEDGYIAIRSRYFNKHFKGIKKEKIEFNEVSEKKVIELIKSYNLAPGKESSNVSGVGGWLFIPLINFFLIYPYTAIQEIIIAPEVEMYFGNFISLIIIAEVILAIYAIYAGYLLVKIRHNALKHSRIVLYSTIVVSVISIIWMYWIFSDYEVGFQPFKGLYQNIGFSIIWLLYFGSSKRVKNTYNS